MMEVTASTLSRQPFLRGLQADQLAALAATAAEVMFPAGTRIFAEGGHTDRFWLLESGHAAVDVQVPGERPAVIGTVGIGAILGWSWLLPPYRWESGAVCVSEVKAIEFSAPAVRACCAADPALAHELTRRLLTVVAERVRGTRATLVAKSAVA